jgi:predicted GIY-YIG superfamily endonuclease
MPQMLLLPDPRPLVERLGQEFFRRAPERPGVYLMRDSADTVVYVGKAKNLRKRLASYRVANPERLKRRQLRLLRAVVKVELQECADEAGALARESELLLSLRPRFNRAGTWPRTPRFLTWRVTSAGLELAVITQVEVGWHFHGPMGAGAVHLRATMVRLLWCAIHPERGLAGMPVAISEGGKAAGEAMSEGWLAGLNELDGLHQLHGETGPLNSFAGYAPVGVGTFSNVAMVPRYGVAAEHFKAAEKQVVALFAGDLEGFAGWVRERAAAQTHPFEVAAREADLETVAEFVKTLNRDRPIP